MSNDLQNTIDLIKQSYADTSKGAMSPDVAKDFNLALSLVPYNLEAGARLLFPVLSPIRNNMPRLKGRGTARRFKCITGINTASVSIWAAEGTSGNQVTTQEVDVTVPYVSMGLLDKVTLEAQVQGEGQVDARALAAANLLRAFMIQEESALLFGQSASAVSAGAAAYNQASGISIGGATTRPTQLPAGNVVGATTGGSLAAATYNVYFTVVNGMGETQAPTTSRDVTTTGATSTVTVTPVAPTGVPYTSFNVYFKLSTDANYRVFSTTGAPVVISAYTAGAATLPAAASDSNALAFNGIMPFLFATNSGAQITKVNAALTSMSTIDTHFQGMWDTNRADPDVVYANSKEAITITNLTLGAGTPYYLTVKEQDGATAGYRVSRLVNKVTGSEVKLDVHPFLPQGNMLTLSTRMPQWYPGSDISNVWAMDLPLDYTQLDYFPVGPKWPFEVRTIGTFLCYLPSIQGALSGIS